MRAFRRWVVVVAGFGMAAPAWAQEAPVSEPTPAPVHASPERLQACVASHERTQVSRNDGDLLAAREAALSCSQATCPTIVQNDCSQWFSEIDRDVSSAVVRVRRGDLDVEARLFVDGKPQAPEALGRALELNPGRHRFRVEPRDAAAQEREVLLAPNEKGRAIQFDLADEAARKPGARPVPTATFVLAGTALALFAGGAVLGGWALSDRAEQAKSLQNGGCAPYCTDHEVAAIEHKAIAADVFFGLGIATGAAAVLSYVWRPETPLTRRAGRPVLSVAATNDAALLGLRGAF